MKPKAALLVLGHGSTENPDSSQPTRDLVDVLVEKGAFASVHAAFWKEEPSFRQVFAAIEEEEIYVVPNFISEGYFTRQVIPRELELDGRTTRRGKKTIHYCDPVGIHPLMTELLANRAIELIGDSTSPGEVALIVVGHGTSLNKNSTAAIKEQVNRLRGRDYPFGEVLEAYMEEAPFISDWKSLANAGTVVVVPFFIADGLHSFEDIPAMIGIPNEGSNPAERDPENPYRFGNRLLYYSRAIGTSPMMSRIVLDQVLLFDQK